MIIPGFRHRMAAHCETGTLTALCNHAGNPISEPMVFGVGSGPFFGYLHMAAFTFPMVVPRTQPGKIRKKVSARLGADFATQTFRSPEKGERVLDELLGRGIPVGVQVDMFYMDYIPPYMKAHFNGHFLVAVGREGDDYLVSDAYYPQITRLSWASMQKARFAKGDMAPKGFIYWARHVPAEVDLRKPIIKGIRGACFNMLSIPVPFLGVRGIRYFADKLMTWPSITRDEEHLSHEIMMLNVLFEERGTGGGAYRFMYATFLQQAAAVLGNPRLDELSRQMMDNGDRWREISLFAARIGKRRDIGRERLMELRQLILARADAEEQLFRALREAVR